MCLITQNQYYSTLIFQNIFTILKFISIFIRINDYQGHGIMDMLEPGRYRNHLSFRTMSATIKVPIILLLKPKLSVTFTISLITIIGRHKL